MKTPQLYQDWLADRRMNRAMKRFATKKARLLKLPQDEYTQAAIELVERERGVFLECYSKQR